MDIIFYKTESANNVVNKVLTDDITLTGQMNGEIDVINPTIRVASNVLIEHNYCYIPDFKRYYYVTRDNIVRKGIHTFYMNVDVLMSFRNEIFDILALLERQESPDYSNPYYDSGYVLDSRETTEKINFTSPFNNGEYVLITIKGGGVNN